MTPSSPDTAAADTLVEALEDRGFQADSVQPDTYWRLDPEAVFRWVTDQSTRLWVTGPDHVVEFTGSPLPVILAAVDAALAEEDE